MLKELHWSFCSCENTRANAYFQQHTVCLLITATGYIAHGNTHSLLSWGEKRSNRRKETSQGILFALHVNMPFCFTSRGNWKCPSLLATTILCAPTKCDFFFFFPFCGGFSARFLIKGLVFIVFCNEIGKWDFMDPFFDPLWHGSFLYKRTNQLL